MFTELFDFLIKLDKELFLFINLKLQNGFFDILMPILTEFKYWRIPFFLVILSMLIFGKRKVRISAIFGAVLFSLFLLYDFDYLEKQSMSAVNNSWSNALDIAFILYLDIINLLLEILEYMGE